MAEEDKNTGANPLVAAQAPQGAQDHALDFAFDG